MPTLRYENGSYVHTVSSTPKTPAPSPVALELASLTEHASEDVRDLAAPVAAHLARLSLRLQGCVAELEALKASSAERQQIAPPAVWAMTSKGPSPALRLHMISNNDDTCKTLFGFTGAFIKALTSHVDTFGALSTTPRYTPVLFREALRQEGVAAAAAAQNSAAAAHVLPPRASANVTSRETSPSDDLAVTLFILHTDASMEHAAWLFGIGVSTVSRIFTTVVTILDKFFENEFPPMEYERARLVTPAGLDDKQGASLPSFALDALEGRHLIPSVGKLNAMFFSQYKNGTTLKYLILVSIGSFFRSSFQATSPRTPHPPYFPAHPAPPPPSQNFLRWLRCLRLRRLPRCFHRQRGGYRRVASHDSLPSAWVRRLRRQGLPTRRHPSPCHTPQHHF